MGVPQPLPEGEGECAGRLQGPGEAQADGAEGGVRGRAGRRRAGVAGGLLRGCCRWVVTWLSRGCCSWGVVWVLHTMALKAHAHGAEGGV